MTITKTIETIPNQFLICQKCIMWGLLTFYDTRKKGDRLGTKIVPIPSYWEQKSGTDDDVINDTRWKSCNHFFIRFEETDIQNLLDYSKRFAEEQREN